VKGPPRTSTSNPGSPARRFRRHSTIASLRPAWPGYVFFLWLVKGNRAASLYLLPKRHRADLGGRSSSHSPPPQQVSFRRRFQPFLEAKCPTPSLAARSRSLVALVWSHHDFGHRRRAFSPLSPIPSEFAKYTLFRASGPSPVSWSGRLCAAVLQDQGRAAPDEVFSMSTRREAADPSRSW